MLKIEPQIISPYKNTYEALKLLVNNSYYAQNKWYEKPYYDSKAFLKEFCTVKLSTARQSGHTTSALQLCNEYFEKSLYLCINQNIAEIIKKQANIIKV